MLINASKHIKSDISVEINPDSGFCFGVVNAIETAESLLQEGKSVYCVGDIVHNDKEVARLEALGLSVISQQDIQTLQNQTILFRAHGEPQSTYTRVKSGNNRLVDATCPIVLNIQKRIMRLAQSSDVQILIYGSCKHPEVIGLMDRTLGKGICIENEEDLMQVDFSKPVALFSQTTKSLDGFHKIVKAIETRAQNSVTINDTICRQVACRGEKMAAFAKTKDLLFFVGGAKSSNAKVLFTICKKNNPNTYFITSEKDIEIQSLKQAKDIGICGATSTPQWLMQQVKRYLEQEIKKQTDINTENYG